MILISYQNIGNDFMLNSIFIQGLSFSHVNYFKLSMWTSRELHVNSSFIYSVFAIKHLIFSITKRIKASSSIHSLLTSLIKSWYLSKQLVFLLVLQNSSFHESPSYHYKNSAIYQLYSILKNYIYMKKNFSRSGAIQESMFWSLSLTKRFTNISCHI